MKEKKSKKDTSIYIHTFLKIFEEEAHADNFLDGKMRFSPLSYFKENNDRGEMTSCGRMDNMEGLIASIHPKDIGELKIGNVSIGKSDLAGSVTIFPLELNDYYIMSVYCISSHGKEGRCYRTQEEMEEDILTIDTRCDKEFGSHVVIFNNPKAFERRIFDALKDKKIGECYAHGMVSYYNKYAETNYFNNSLFEPLFNKHKGYEYQKEYRFAFEPSKSFVHSSQNAPIFLDIGNIRDIAIKITLEDLRKYMKFTHKGDD